jgi:hypothetical protein
VIKSRRMRWTGNIARMGKGEVCTGFWWEAWGKENPGGSRRRWENNIRIDLKEVGCECEDWIGLSQDRTGGGRLWVRWGKFGYHKTRGISWLAANS